MLNGFIVKNVKVIDKRDGFSFDTTLQVHVLHWQKRRNGEWKEKVYVLLRSVYLGDWDSELNGRYQWMHGKKETVFIDFQIVFPGGEISDAQMAYKRNGGRILEEYYKHSKTAVEILEEDIYNRPELIYGEYYDAVVEAEKARGSEVLK